MPFLQESTQNNTLSTIFTMQENESNNFEMFKKEKLSVNKYNAITLSENNLFIAIASSHSIYIYNTQENKLVQQIATYKETVNILSFDKHSNYIVAGTVSGRVYLYKIVGLTSIARLCSFPYKRSKIKYRVKNNFVSAITFYADTMACSGYGGAIFVMNLYSGTKYEALSHNKTRVDALFFLNNDTLISGNKDGILYISSLNNEKPPIRIETRCMNIQKIILMQNPNFIIIYGKDNFVSLINIKNYKVIKDKYLIFKESIKNISKSSDSSIIVNLENDESFHLDLPNTQRLNELIQKNLFKNAFTLIEQELMLQDSVEHNKIEDIYKKFYKKAAKALLDNNKDLAKKIMNLFLSVQSKEEEINLLFKSIEFLERFVELCEIKNYNLAYSMSNKFPLLKETANYINMENLWKSTFIRAQKDILQGNYSNAKIILKPYSNISSKKSIINLILVHNTDFISFLKAIEDKEYMIAYKLTCIHPAFLEIPTYIVLKEEINIIYKKIEPLIQSNNIDDAENLIKIIEEMPYLSEKIDKLKTLCKLAHNFQEYYENKNLIQCYELMDENDYLNKTILGKLLQKNWIVKLKSCEYFALLGRTSDVKKTFGNLIKIKSRQNKIADLFRVSYLMRIKALTLKMDFVQAEKNIYAYSNLFGMDYELKQSIEVYEKKSSQDLNLTENQKLRFDRNSFLAKI